ncbi:hypothetical protein JQ824_06500 [Brachyspira hyodysenteriae]|uniref:tetratricopeptide repeat protein n=1 Tax=Brachyspira hyodysenteriae TaxID=159 RepID=UPI0011846A5D|nr:hypothetical protein [Brachyspira hyodysenteriae]MBT8720038.1 hypothetical protein [Brachyspira hyodysenteriae]MBT8730277.1 hypothetical protein [Brachyspira hyodysenteriae]MBT8732699.1 hypothetical protein [Brachyspira hyodysenteriae]MBT8735176.1 hypothetical protein [Brachyspira hyodysenteriae]MBT8737817.1 hypothetical protein [Brachyspira hyodysenteriae]
MKSKIADKAYTLIKKKKYKKAKEMLLNNKVRMSHDAEALAMLSFADIFLKDFYGAEELSRKALREDNFCFNAMLAKAYISLHNGHRENALREYFRILDLDPENKVAKDNIERIRFLTNNARGDEINPRAYLLGKKKLSMSRFLVLIPIAFILTFLSYITIDRVYPKIRYVLLDKEQKELREKLENVYLFEGLEDGKIPESAKSPTYSPREVAEMFDKAKNNMRSASVNEAVMIINGALKSDINEYLKERFRVLKQFVIAPDYNIFRESPDYLTVVANYDLYNGGYVKWKADVNTVGQTNIDGIPKKRARLLIYDTADKNIAGVADLIVNVTVTLEPKNYIEVYGKILGYDAKQKSIQLEGQIIKHLPKKK